MSGVVHGGHELAELLALEEFLDMQHLGLGGQELEKLQQRAFPLLHNR